MNEATEKKHKNLKSIFNKVLVNYSECDSHWYNKVINAYGGTINDPWPFDGELEYEDMPVLFECIRVIPEKKVRYQTLLHNVYHILDDLSQPLSFARVEKLVDILKNTNEPIPDPEKVYEGNIPDERIIKEVIADLTDVEQVRKLLIPIVEDIDTYIEKWGIHEVRYRIDPPKGVRAWATDEDGLFSAAVSFPEFHPILEIILQKIIEANRIYPLFKEYGNSSSCWRYYTGYSIMAHFAACDPQKYDPILLEFIRDIEIESAENISRLLRSIYNCWDKTNIPNLPLTFEAYPELAPEGYFTDIYIDVSDTFSGDWDKLIEILLNTKRVNRDDKKQLMQLDEERAKCAHQFMLFDNGFLGVLTNQEGNKVFITKPYTSLYIDLPSQSAGINNHKNENYEFDFPPAVFEKVSDFLSSYDYNIEEVNTQPGTYVQYNVKNGLDIDNIKLPEDTDFSDTTTDHKTEDLEISHNTPLINRILTILLESEDWNSNENLVLKQFIADIPNFSDMLLSKAGHIISISCNKEVEPGKYDFQMMNFMLSDNILSILTAVQSTMTHILTVSEKERIIGLFKEYKPEWVLK